MSDVGSVAAAMGVPEELVSRSAAARATAAGTTTEDVLGAWGGGAAVVTTPAPAAVDGDPAPDPAPEPESVSQEESVPAPTPASAATTPVVAAATGPQEPPVLVGAHDNPWSIVAGVIGIFIAVVLLGVVGPSIPVDEPGARSSAVALTEVGLEGRALYADLGCAGCHTQMIRPIIADVGVGPVTLSDTNQVLGARRFGPDLANIGNRMSGAQMESTVLGLGGHPAASLSEADMDRLVTYLLESAPSGGGS